VNWSNLELLQHARDARKTVLTLRGKDGIVALYGAEVGGVTPCKDFFELMGWVKKAVGAVKHESLGVGH
jgi:hypothetical protein